MNCNTLFTPRDRQNYQRFSAWMIGAMLTFMAATLLIDGAFVAPVIGWTLTAIAIVLMVTAMRSYVLFLRVADELLRKVHLEALAFGFGAGVVGMMGYRLCERLGAPKLDVNDAVLIMLLGWISGQILGARRYSTAEEE